VTKPLSKKIYIYNKIKFLLFHQQSGFQTKELWLSFVLKAFDFISGAKFLLKIHFVLKEKEEFPVIY